MYRLYCMRALRAQAGHRAHSIWPCENTITRLSTDYECSGRQSHARFYFTMTVQRPYCMEIVNKRIKGWRRKG